MQETPSDHCYVLLQNHGPDKGGWGTAAVQLAGMGGPFVYTGSDARTISALHEIAGALAEATGKETLLAKFTQREDVVRYEKREERYAV